MAPSYEIIRYRPELKRQVVELQTHLWSPSLALNTSYFQWKYEQNPYIKEPLIYLAMHCGEAIGMRGFFGVQWEGGVPTRQFTNLYADDMVIAPEHRHCGLMSKIMTFAFDDLENRGYDYVFNLSAGSVTLRSSLSMGWRSAGWAHPMRWRSWRTAVRNRVLGRMRSLPLLSRKLDRLPSRRTARSGSSLGDFDLDRMNRLFERTSAISVHTTPNCAAMAELVSRVGNVGRIRHVRNSEYFNWRLQNPQSRYRFLFWQEDRLEGYLVLQEYTSESAPHDVVNIVDWEASSAAVQEGLLEAAFAFAQDRSLVVWSATLPQSAIALLKKSGFRSIIAPKAPAPPAVLVRPLHRQVVNGTWSLAGQALLDLASWDLRMLYSMIG
jgi:GNAT superfamily N-acetyltransferase